MKKTKLHDYIVEYALKDQPYIARWTELCIAHVENATPAIKYGEKCMRERGTNPDEFYIRARLIK